ncbi:MAG: signal recognition particle-docking protein FtsY [Treponema sp.]|jgi:fused signal recognition particle receptor|nr:signal recognition particle-docking protein FtsY [Treponema sp.]
MKFAERIKNFFTGSSALSDDFFEELSGLLVEGDFGAAEAVKTTELLRDCCKKERIVSPEQARLKLAALLEEVLQKGGVAVPVPPGDRLAVILMLGVNGVGKTTTAAKLAALYRDQYGRKPILAAADTFRAAAIDQLKIHGERLGLRVIAHRHGGDPAAVVYDAVEAAQAGGGNLIIADTAGRMHTKSALVEELRKIDRVVEAKAAGAEYIKYLVLDATTGRNALAQAEIFCGAVAPRAAILAKYDSTARGGVVFSLASGLHLPVVYLCTGEKYGDIQVFDPQMYAREFAGIV